MKIKRIQSLIGHSDAGVTATVFPHLPAQSMRKMRFSRADT